MIDDLRCYGDMYLYRLEGGWLHKYTTNLICYLSVTILSYLLGTLTNSNQIRYMTELIGTYLLQFYPIC
jgi:hypothetical protein